MGTVFVGDRVFTDGNLRRVGRLEKFLARCFGKRLNTAEVEARSWRGKLYVFHVVPIAPTTEGKGEG
jgi:hypothetical protein